MITYLRAAVLLGVMALASARSAIGQVQHRYESVVDQILAAWKSADVVCLGEDHARYFDNELRIALVRHPAFARTVRAVVVEMANPVYQDLLDRFILDGAAMSRDELAPIWRDATNPEVWESPIYEALLRAIREVNLKLDRDQRVRVIAGDSKVDWATIKRPEDLIPLMNRGANIREIIATQVLEPHLKALAIYGAGHCNKMGTGFPVSWDRVTERSDSGASRLSCAQPAPRKVGPCSASATRRPTFSLAARAGRTRPSMTCSRLT